MSPHPAPAVAAPEAAPPCPHCRRPRHGVTRDLPLGLGRRTFVIECPCEAERRQAEADRRRLAAHEARVRQLLAESGIGARYRHATFETLEVTPETAPIVEVCRAFVTRFPDGGRGLTLAGPPGTGKSHLGVAVTRALIARGVRAVFVNVPELLVTFRSSVHGETSARFDELLGLCIRCDHLWLDDVGRERMTAWVQETLYLVINARYNASRATSLTTNLDRDGLRRHLGEAVADRLAETNAVYWCQWSSRRQAAHDSEVR